MRDSHRMHDGIDLHLDNRQIAAFVIASLVVAGAVFSVGVLVGKQLAVAASGPAKPGDALAAIDEKEKARTPESVTGTGEIPTPKTDLNYQKELTKPSTASPAIEPTKPATAKAADEKAEPKKEEKKDEAAKKDEAKKEEPKKEAKKEDEAKKKESLSAAFDKATKTDEEAGEEKDAGGFTLQVASLPTKEEADKLVDRLTSKGLKPYVVEADVPGKGHVFRVRSGTYATRDEAETGLKAFKKKSALPAIIANR